MKIYLATDHAGFELKNQVKDFLQSDLGCEVVDLGALTHDPLDDYPDYIALAAAEVSKQPTDRAVIFGGSGQGEAMLANRYPNVRATVFYGGDPKIVTLSREHNDANVLSLGARFLEAEEAFSVLKLWLEANPLEDEKYSRRVKKAERLSRER